MSAVQIDNAERAENVRLLGDSVASFAGDRTDHRRTRALRGQLPGFDPAIAAEMAALGWCGVLIPERDGGLGLGFSEMAVVLRGLGRGLLAEPLAATAVLGTRALIHAAGDALRSTLLPQIAEGKLSVALAWQEERGGIDAGAVTATASIPGKEVRLNGAKRFVCGAAAAAEFLVTAKTAHGIGLYRVSRDAPGIELKPEWHADGTPAGTLSLRDAPAQVVCDDPGRAVEAVNRAVDEAAIMASAELMGVLSETLDRTIEYLKTRVQFDRPIGSFQALQHQSVDLYILREICESVLGDAVRALDDPSTAARERALMASRAKARLSDGALRITREAIQLHGAIAVTDECDIGLYFKRAITLSAWLGNAEVHRRRFVELSHRTDQRQET